MGLIYIYDGTYDGLLTSLFEAFNHRETPLDILPTESAQTDFLNEVRHIQTCQTDARRLERGILRSIGQDAASYVYAAAHSANKHAGRYMLEFLRLGFRVGESIYERLSDDTVIRVMRVSKHVWHEVERWNQFLRFRELDGGVYIAQYEPEHDVTELIMPHFATRFCVQPFILHDKKRQIAGVYDLHGWVMASSQDMILPKQTASEMEYQQMWKLFYHTIAIKERTNYKCRQNMMPKKYWKDMIEMQG